MDRNYCLIVFIVYMSYSDTYKVAKCSLYEKKVDVYQKRKKRGGNIGSCPQVPVKGEGGYNFDILAKSENTKERG